MFHLILFGFIPLISSANTPPDYIPEEPIYPFQQYIQVRKSYSVQHLPQPSNHIEQEYPSNSEDGGEHENGGSWQVDSPMLKEEISDYKKQEVYEEKGFTDKAYDHRSYKYFNNDHSQYGDNHNYQGAPSSHNPKTTAKNQLYEKLHGNGRSTDILKYAESNLYDQDAHRFGIYEARAGIFCPEVIDFNLDPEKGDLHTRRNPKLRGLGDKISCLKGKYFGTQPLPSAIFQNPTESKQSLIKFGTMQQFMNEVHKNVNPMFPPPSAAGNGGMQIGFL